MIWTLRSQLLQWILDATVQGIRVAAASLVPSSIHRVLSEPKAGGWHFERLGPRIPLSTDWQPWKALRPAGQIRPARPPRPATPPGPACGAFRAAAFSLGSLGGRRAQTARTRALDRPTSEPSHPVSLPSAKRQLSTYFPPFPPRSRMSKACSDSSVPGGLGTGPKRTRDVPPST